MPERQSRHPDNKLIDELQENATPNQQGRAGGNVNRRVGTRAELNNAEAEGEIERATGSDNPAQDSMKGAKTRAEIQAERNDS